MFEEVVFVRLIVRVSLVGMLGAFCVDVNCYRR